MNYLDLIYNKDIENNFGEILMTYLIKGKMTNAKSFKKKIDDQIIDVSKNNLSEIDLTSLSNSSIERLDLSNNDLQEIDLTPLETCYNLVSLNLQKNKFKKVDLTPLVESVNLRMILTDFTIRRTIDKRKMGGISSPGVELLLEDDLVEWI